MIISMLTGIYSHLINDIYGIMFVCFSPIAIPNELPALTKEIMDCDNMQFLLTHYRFDACP